MVFSILWLLSLLLLVKTQDVLTGKYNVVWTSPTEEDDPTYFKGGMPLGNGDTQVLSWANLTQGGVSLYISKQDAMHSDTSNYKVALVTLSLSPNPFTEGSFFNQTLDISSASMILTLGGTNATPSVTLTVYVDSGSNTVYVTAQSLTSQLYTYTALLTPVRPDGYAPYLAPWQCTPVSSAPDEVVDPLPSTTPPFPTPGGTLIVLHSNLDSDYSGVGSGGVVNHTLFQQGLGDPAIVATVPDLWRGRKFGVAVDTPPSPSGGGCAPLTRLASPLSLHSTSPAPCVTLRISTLSSTLYPTQDEWVGALAAQMALLPPTPPRAQHEAYWRGFWARSFVDITMPAAATPPPPPPPPPHLSTTAMPSGYALWLRASSLVAQASSSFSSLPNNSAVCAWGDGQTTLTQPNATQCPTLLYNALGSGGGSNTPSSSQLLPGVHFSQALHTFLSDHTLALPTRSATILVVFKDMGSNGGEGDGRPPCCSGVVSLAGSFLGISTLPSSGSGGNDDDDNPLGPPSPSSTPTTPPAMNVLGDFGGSQLLSALNVLGRTVVAAVTFDGATSTASLFLDGCAQGAQSYAGAPAGVPGVMVGSRGADVYERYFEGVVGEVVVFPRLLSDSELGNASGLLTSAYNLTYYPPHATQCGGKSGSKDGLRVSQTYAMSRYMNVIQSRVVGGGGQQQQPTLQQPIKFNGLSWTSRRPGAPSAACSPHPVGPDCRQWGPNNWWQNLRLPVWPMLADGDWKEMDIAIDYYLRSAPFLRARAQALRGPNASSYPSMLWQTETSTLFGSFCEVDWVGDGSCASTRPPDLPLWLQNNPYIYLDPFGDGPTGELGLMILDRFLYDQDEAGLALRLPWIVGALEYVAFSYYNQTSRTLEVYPTQACETLWSPWPLSPTAPERVVNDAPTISVVRRLLERALGEIPPALTPPGATALWRDLLAAMPPLPLDPTGTKLASAGFFSGPTKNSESVAMYSTHPTRTFSVGRQVTAGIPSLDLPISTFLSDPFSGGGGASGQGNDGWHQGCIHAPLLGLRNLTGPYLVARTYGKPLPGFRFPFFSGEDGMADEAAAEAFSNMAAGVQYALMQPGDDEKGSVVVFGGWPCDWDVHFKLWGPWNTTVEGVWEGGALLSLTVTPSSRAASVIVAPGC